VVFLITYVVPNFAQLYSSMQAKLPQMTLILIAVGTTARNYILAAFLALVAAVFGFRLWSRGESGARKNRPREDAYSGARRRSGSSTRWRSCLARAEHAAGRRHSAVAGAGYGGAIPGHKLLQRALETAARPGEGRAVALGGAGNHEDLPGLSIDMIEVGESTGPCPRCWPAWRNSTRTTLNTRMQAALSLIEPLIMMCMGVFVAFVLVALYLPIFSLADTLG